MRTRRVFILGVLVLLGSVLAPACAQAAGFDPLGFRLSSAAYFVHERDRVAVITVQRITARRAAEVHYIAFGMTAVSGQDFVRVKSVVRFKRGQARARFRIKIIDHHMPDFPRTVKIALFGPWPIGLSRPRSAVLTIINDDRLTITRIPGNPLGLPHTPPASDPLRGARAFVDSKGGRSAIQARHWRHSHPRAARMLEVIAREPDVTRFGNTESPKQVGLYVSRYMRRAAREGPGRVPELSTYWLVWHHCGHASDPAWRVSEYHRWIRNLALGISGRRAIIFLEVDALITINCLSPHGRYVRLHELHYAIDVLSRLPRVVVYLDAGAADALPAKRTARLLRKAGVAKIRGFALNSTHFDWTRHEIRYGEEISRMTGGKHFVVNTAENGRGPLRPAHRGRDGNEVLCNPRNRGLGPKPTFNTGYRRVDAFAWIQTPGRSGGECRPGAPPTGWYWPALALELVRNRDFRVR